MLWLITPTSTAMRLHIRDLQRVVCVVKLKVSTTQPRLHMLDYLGSSGFMQPIIMQRTSLIQTE
jgi:hypothetical protein